jgi:hypothetical protein
MYVIITAQEKRRLSKQNFLSGLEWRLDVPSSIRVGRKLKINKRRIKEVKSDIARHYLRKMKTDKTWITGSLTDGEALEIIQGKKLKDCDDFCFV